MILILLLIWIIVGFVIGTVLHDTILDNLFKPKACITLLLCGPLMWLVFIAAGVFAGLAILLANLAELIQDWIEE